MLNTRWISLAVLGVCAYALFIIGGDDRFYLNYIPVEGATSLDINHVVAESGLAGRHIFAADPQEAADHLGQMGGVITASVTLHWPNDVSIILREKPPLATWQEGDEAYWVDEDGGLSPARAQTVGLLSIVSEVTSDKAEVTSDELRATSEERRKADEEQATDDEPSDDRRRSMPRWRSSRATCWQGRCNCGRCGPTSTSSTTGRRAASAIRTAAAGAPTSALART